MLVKDMYRTSPTSLPGGGFRPAYYHAYVAYIDEEGRRINFFLTETDGYRNPDEVPDPMDKSMWREEVWFVEAFEKRKVRIPEWLDGAWVSSGTETPIVPLVAAVGERYRKPTMEYARKFLAFLEQLGPIFEPPYPISFGVSWYKNAVEYIDIGYFDGKMYHVISLPTRSE